MDVRHVTLSLGDGTLLVYRLPAPARPAPPPLTEAALGAKGGGEVQAAPAGAPTITSLAPLWSAPPPPTTDASAPADPADPAAGAGELRTPPGWAQAHAHFLLAPAPRAVSEPLAWLACGVVWWRRTEPCMTQSLWSAAAGGEEAADGAPPAGPPSPLTWQLPHRPTASTCSADSSVIATGLEDGSVVVWDTALRSEVHVLQKHR